ncbi:MAG: hypothetical protein ABIW47_19180 [Ginsengibacter sp.]|jgi:PBP1b-binding outer membrane lipoprotein LpoB
MKKLFLIFAVSAFFVACNDSASTTEEVTPATEEVTPAPVSEKDTLVVMPTDSLPAATETPAQ